VAVDDPEDVKAFSVSEVNQAVGAALAASFPAPFWVVGEIQGYERDLAKAGQRRWGQVYFELVEKEAGSDALRARAKSVMWGDVGRRVAARLAEAGADVRLADGLKVKLLCQVDFYWPWASLQLKVLDADPHFTVGDMEKARRELVERLKREGVFDLNRAVPMPVAPQVLGLVTSEGSAAYHDFLQELKGSGFGFTVILADARMQGEDTESGVVRALKALEADPSVELIALVRGGGSRSDLMWFDREKIAFAVARCSKPVVTGIGHEIDLSVADLAAHTSQKTPTACAAFLVDRVRAFADGVGRAAERLAASARLRTEEAARALTNAVTNWRHLTGVRLRSAAERLSEAAGGLTAGARRHLAVRRERLAAVGPRLGRGTEAFCSARRDALKSFEKELGLKDPRRLLERGYGLIYADGRLVKSVAVLAPGSSIEARVRDGSARAAVLSVQREES
jgi:exodeoxyribonuclease VII large subunit